MDWNKIVETIQTLIEEIRLKYVLENPVIGDDIFGILESYCVVIYYPFEEEKNRGFHAKRFVKNELKDFVYINTAMPIVEQVFAAAHELGHVWKVAEKIQRELVIDDESMKSITEDIINRFAAELLMPEEEFKRALFQHISELNISKSEIRFDEMIRVMVMLMNDFKVPYESVRRRFDELDIISESSAKMLSEKNKGVTTLICEYIKDINTTLDLRTMKKTIPGIRNLIEAASAKQSIDEYTLCKIKADFDFEEYSGGDRIISIISEGN